MIIPIMPGKPNPPSQFVYKNCGVYDGTTIQEIKKELKISDEDLLKVGLEKDWDGNINAFVNVKNPDFDEEMLDYERKMKVYNIELEQYKKDFEEYNKNLNKKKIEEAKALLRSVGESL